MARGELPADLDLDLLVDRLVGPVHFRLLVTGAPVSTDDIADLVAGILASLAPTPATE